MGEVTYTISQAAKLLEVESHVLRFWEEELLLDIGRNAKGYRVYTKENIDTMQKIKELKKNHALKDIRSMLCEKDERELEFYAIMEKVIGKTLEERNSPEGRFKAIDQAIRSRQQAGKMVAATLDKGKKTPKKGKKVSQKLSKKRKGRETFTTDLS